jgi:TRAP-type C4-dicarboxylate transport system substrate-binding protein
VHQERLPDWEQDLIEEAITVAQRRLTDERERARRRAVQLAREQGYHRLAVAIDRPKRASRIPGQLTLFPTDRTLFDDDE